MDQIRSQGQALRQASCGHEHECLQCCSVMSEMLHSSVLQLSHAEECHKWQSASAQVFSRSKFAFKHGRALLAQAQVLLSHTVMPECAQSSVKLPPGMKTKWNCRQQCHLDSSASASCLLCSLKGANHQAS